MQNAYQFNSSTYSHTLLFCNRTLWLYNLYMRSESVNGQFQLPYGPEVAFRYHCDCRSIHKFSAPFRRQPTFPVSWRRDLGFLVAEKLPPSFFSHIIFYVYFVNCSYPRVALEYRKLNLCAISFCSYIVEKFFIRAHRISETSKIRRANDSNRWA